MKKLKNLIAKYGILIASAALILLLLLAGLLLFAPETLFRIIRFGLPIFCVLVVLGTLASLISDAVSSRRKDA